MRLLRPWALLVPILVLIGALPLLRPLRHPDANQISDDEAARIATVAAIVEHHTLALENLNLGSSVPLPNTGLVRSHGHIYSAQPPAMAVFLAGPYWVLAHFHFTFESSPIFTPFLLTLICVTIPVAGAAGLVYKMGRLFDLKRPIRCLLSALVVFGSGLFSYSVVLNPHALAAALILGAVGSIIYVANSPKPRRNIWWLLIAGVCVSLAMVLDPPAAMFLFPLILVVMAMRWPLPRRVAGMALIAVGAIPPLYLHLALNYPITGDWKPAILHRELMLTRIGDRADLAVWPNIGASLVPASPPADSEDDSTPYSDWHTYIPPGIRFLQSLFGPHGLLLHFPAIILGFLGIASVSRRHWPMTTKCLAIATFAGAVSVVVAYSLTRADSRGAMFANRWFIVFLPLTLYWMGAWLRRPHGIFAWSAAGLLLAFSIAVSLLGATDPLPRGGYDRYTAAAAAQRLFSTDAPVVPARIADANGN